jgi:DNA-binding transcriptional regulator GbsR (MarR family)
MADPERLTFEQSEFIESMGVFFEYFGLPRIIGRLMGLLMLADHPLTLDDMARALLVSRASVSTNIRIALHHGYAVRVGIPGDRRDFYRFSDDVWEKRSQVTLEASNVSRAMAERGLAALGPEDVSARAHLEEMRDYCDFSIEEANTMLARWRERKRAARATQRPAHAADTVPDAGASDESVAIERDSD